MFIAIEKHRFLYLWVLSVLGSVCILPYLRYSGLISDGIPFLSLLGITLLQSLILYGIVCFIAYKLLPKTGVHPFPSLAWKQQLLIGVCAGIAMGLGLYLLDHYLFPAKLKIHTPPLWIAFFVAVYGAINEEILCRLFLLPLLFFTLIKFFQAHEHRRGTLFWIANFFVATAFSALHLLALYVLLLQPTILDILRVFVINGIAGVGFGWLFWMRGIWVVMVAHFFMNAIFYLGL